jgi:hypothetical protein
LRTTATTTDAAEINLKEGAFLLECEQSIMVVDSLNAAIDRLAEIRKQEGNWNVSMIHHINIFLF